MWAQRTAEPVRAPERSPSSQPRGVFKPFGPMVEEHTRFDVVGMAALDRQRRNARRWHASIVARSAAISVSTERLPGTENQRQAGLKERAGPHEHAIAGAEAQYRRDDRDLRHHCEPS